VKEEESVGKGIDLLQLKMECTRFFIENPYAYESLDGLAIRVGRKPESLIPVIDEMIVQEILESIHSGKQKIYHYKKPNEYSINLSIEPA
jgi:hypothetical protein